MVKLYTSYYKKMLSYPKRQDVDFFIQISKTYPFWFRKSGKILLDFADYDQDDPDHLSADDFTTVFWNEFDTIKEYKEYLNDLKNERYNILETLASFLSEMVKEERQEVCVFFLDYGDFSKKPSHRRIWADFMKENFDLDIPEYID
jgi:hypothetical protein